MPTRAIPTRYILGTGVAASAITTIAANITDIRRMISTMGVVATVVLSAWLIHHNIARRTDRRLLRVTEHEAVQTQHLRHMAHAMAEDTGDDTGPQPLRSVT
jgi:hypothetical protein